MNRFQSLIVLLLLVGFCRPCHAEDDSGSETRTYGAWINNVRVGSARITVARIEIDGKPAVKMTAAFELRIKTAAGQNETGMEQTTIAMEDGATVRMTKRTSENGIVRTQHFTYDANRASREEKFLGRSTRVEVETQGPIVDEGALLLRHLARNSKLEVGATFDFRSVSFERKRTYQKKLHVDERIVKKDGSILWRVHTTSELEDDPEEERLVVDTTGHLVEMSTGPLSVRAIDPSELDFETADKPPFGSAVATKPSIARHHLERLRSLIVRVHLPAGKAVFRTNGYQKVLEQDGRTFRLQLVPNADTDKSKVTIPIDKTRLDVFLRETKRAESGAPKIVELSAKIVGDTTLASEVAGRICKWMRSELDQVVNGASLTALETLKAGKGDCSEHTSLYLALARAAKLPSRSVTGLLLTADGFGLHAWAESWMGRWVPVDPAWNRVGTGPVYLSLGPDLDDDGIARSTGLRMAAAFGSMSIEILELDLDGQRFDATNANDIWKSPDSPDAIVERVVLRSGLAFFGTEVARDDGHLVFRTPYGRTRIARTDLDRVEYRRGGANHFESVEHGLSFDLPEDWEFVDKSQWPNARTISMFRKGNAVYGLLLWERFPGKISEYFALLRAKFKTTDGTDEKPTSRTLPSKTGDIDALRWHFVNAENDLHYRLLTWQTGGRCFRIVVWTTAGQIDAVGSEIDAVLESIQLR